MPTWMIYAFVFASAFLAVQGLISLVANRRAQNRVEKRYGTIAPRRDPTLVVEGLRKKEADLRGPFGGLARLLARAGSRLSPRGAILWMLVLAAPVYLVLPLPALLAAPAAAAIGAGLVLLRLRMMQARRMKQFGAQLPDLVDVMVRSLRAGHPLPVAVGLVAREMPAPAGPEFALVADEIAYGRSLPDALDGLYERVGVRDLNFLIASVGIAQQTGGNLGEILSRLSTLLRDRIQLRRKVRSLSSEGRFSAIVLSLLPVIVFGLINLIGGDMFRDAWGDPILNFMLGVAAVLIVIGNLVMYRMVNFKV